MSPAEFDLLRKGDAVTLYRKQDARVVFHGARKPLCFHATVEAIGRRGVVFRFTRGDGVVRFERVNRRSAHRVHSPGAATP